VSEVNEDLVQEPNETLEHFITRVVEKWEGQGVIIADGKTLAVLERSPEETCRERGEPNVS